MAKKKENIEVEEVKIENIEMEEVKKKTKSWSSAFSTIALVLRIFEYIGIVSLLFVLIFIPIIGNNIKFDKEQITIFDEKIEYHINEVDVGSIKFKGKEYKLNTKDLIKISNLDIDYSRVKYACMEGIIFLIAEMIVSIILLKKAGNLFKRMSSEDKIFVKDGNKTIYSLMILSIVNYAILLVCGMVMAITLRMNYNININIELIISILSIYFLSLIYKYGECLEENK